MREDSLDAFKRSLWGAVILMVLMTLICAFGFVLAAIDGSWALGIVSAAGFFSSAALGLLCVDDLRNIRP